MSSAVAALLHAIRMGVKIVPREKSGTKRLPGVSFCRNYIALQYMLK